jgi:hypothetical protein
MSQDLEGRLDNFSVSREHGDDLAVTMGDTLLPTLEDCILELVANTHDADASVTKIDYNVTRGTLTIEDDGSGMDQTGLNHFFRMGESQKKVNPITPNGRHVIGRFGIATLALRMLARSHVLDAYQDGVHYRVRETFSDKDKDHDSIPVEVKACNASKHGVRITLKDLRFAPGDGRFDLEELRLKLKNEMRLTELGDQFDIYVNKKLVGPAEIKYTAEYIVDFDHPLTGPVTGSILYCRQSLGSDAGIYTKVNGRAVGGTNQELFGKTLPLSVSSRTYGVVHVNGLEDKIRFDRSGFKGCPEVRELQEQIRGVLRQVISDAKGDLKDSKIENARATLAEVLPVVGEEIAKALGEEGTYSFIFDPRKAGDLVALDQGNKVVYVNPDAAPLALSGLQPREIRSAVARMGEYALMSVMVEDEDQHDSFEDFTTSLVRRLHPKRSLRKGRSLANILPRGALEDNDTYDPSLVTRPARLYSLRELPARTGQANSIWKRLISSGIVDEFKLGGELVVQEQHSTYEPFTRKSKKWNQARILGSAVLEAQRLIGRRVPLYEAARRVPLPPGTKNDFVFYQRNEVQARKHLDAMALNSSLPEGVENLAGPDRPSFYVLEPSLLDDLAELVEKGKFPDQILRSHRVYSSVSFGSETLFAYAVALGIKDDRCVEQVRREIKAELHFNADINDRRLTRKESYLLEHEGQWWVSGVYYGSQIEPTAYEKVFEGNGFRRVEVEEDVVAPICETLSERNRRHFPLISVGSTGKPEYRVLVECLAQ